MLKKNGWIELDITDIGVNGEGIGRYEDFTFFVKDALPGDRVRAIVTKMKKGYGYAKMQQVLVPSEHRTEPPCPLASRCGGCQIMQLDYPEQLRIKEAKVRSNLERIGGFSDLPLQHIIGMDSKPEEESVPLRFRNKMQFPVGLSKEGKAVTGFYAGRTHYLVEAKDCPAAFPETKVLLAVIREFIDTYRIPVYNEETGSGLVRHILIRKGFVTGQIMVCLVINGTSLRSGIRTEEKPESLLVQRLLAADLSAYQSVITSICMNVNTVRTNVILGDQVLPLYGNSYIEDQIGELTFRISPLAFFQVNSVQTKKLYGKALEYAGLTGQETVWDLYCGTGSISLFLAQKAKMVYGVEIIPQAIENAKENGIRNGIGNAEFFCGKSEELFPQMCREEGRAADVVVLDPPRKGCDPALLEAILQVQPERIVYVSCDSATLARDLKILSGSYHLEEVTPVDMFPHTMHVECVVLMSRIQG